MKGKTKQISNRMKLKQRILYSGLIFFILLMSYPELTNIHPTYENQTDLLSSNKISSSLLDQMARVDDDETLDVIVATREKINQLSILGLEKRVGSLDIRRIFTVYPALEIRTSPTQIEALAAEKTVTSLVWSDLKCELFIDEAQSYSNTDDLRESSGYNVNGSGITVALIDTGIWTGHYDLDDGQVIGFKDIYGNGTLDDFSPPVDGIDNQGHGTAMAAIIASSGDTMLSDIGVAPGVKIVGVRAGNDSMNLDYGDLLDALNWVGLNAENQSIDIVSCSWGTGRSMNYNGDNETTCDILARTADALVTDYGLIVVAAAGNAGTYWKTVEPSSGNYTIAVGAVHDPSEQGWSLWNVSVRELGSCTGPVDYFDINGYGTPDWYSPDVVAPGVNIKTANISGSNDYIEINGTSASAAFVSGMIALYLDYNESLASDNDGDGYPDIKQLLWASAIELSEDENAGIDGVYGAGRVDGVAGLDFFTTDISSSKDDTVSFTATYTRYNEPMWLLDAEDWYKYTATSDVDFVINVTCDPDLMVEVILYRESTLEEYDNSTTRGDDCYITHTGYSGASYYILVRVIGESSNPKGFPGDYYDIVIDITSY